MAKNSIKTAIFSTFILGLLSVSIFAGNQNQGLNVGETIPNPEFYALNRYEYDQMHRTIRMHEFKDEKNLLVAFMPSVSDKNSYARVMTTAFDTYFAEGLAFVNEYGMPMLTGDLKVLIVTPESEPQLKDYMQKLNLDFEMVSDAKLDVSHFFGVTGWASENDGSLVYVVDKNNKIVYASNDYKGEGEKLRAVQKELFSLNGINNELNENGSYNSTLIQGDEARDFEFTYIYTGLPTAGFKTTDVAKLSDYYGKKNVLIAFYPAPFSYSCAVEVSSFNTYAEEQMLKNVTKSNMLQNDDLEILMVSNSNALILNKWKNEMNIENIKLVSDYSGEISSKYNSFGMGFSKRTVFLINKEGKVSYIDWDYQVNDDDFALVKEQINSLD